MVWETPELGTAARKAPEWETPVRKAPAQKMPVRRIPAAEMLRRELPVKEIIWSDFMKRMPVSLILHERERRERHEDRKEPSL